MLDGVEIKRSICTFCAGNCAVLVHVKDGQILKIEGNKEHPISRGFICERPRYAARWLNHPEQLRYPLKRAGERGENKWERITWEQAMDEISAKLGSLKEQYGPETLAVTEGTVRGALFWLRSRFCNLFGNPHNAFHPGVTCALNRYSIGQAIAGWRVCDKAMTPKKTSIERTNLLVFWGSSPTESLQRASAWISERRKDRTLKSIVVDPRVTKVAELADYHLQLRPGTDTALALGWANVIINEGLYDKEFVQKWTLGFDKLVERVQDYPPARVATITGLTEEQITGSARLYASTKPAWIIGGLAPDQIGLNGTRVEQACAICQALTGNVDILGGSIMPGIGPKNEKGVFIRDSMLEMRDKLPLGQRKKQLGADRFKLMTYPGYELTAGPYEKFYGVPAPAIHRMGASAPLLWRAILNRQPYPITAMISWESNPMAWAANTKIVHEAMKSPNLALYVVLEYWMTPSALMADYVLPVASWLERAYMDTIEDFADFAIGGERAIEPLGERKEDYYFWRELGRRLGQAEYWTWENSEEMIAERVKPMGLSYADFVQAGCLLSPLEEKKYEKYGGFATPSGKFELYSTILEKLGYDPLPFYEEPAESPIRTPEVFKEYPLILNTGGRFMPQHHSEFRHFGMGMREKHPDPWVDINPDDAAGLGIQEGEWVFIESRRGKIKQRARVTDRIPAGIVNCEASWWFPEKPGEEPSLHGAFDSNANVLCLDEPDCCDPLTGGWQSRALLCKVYKM
ncbi:MAG TPA: molybdopterin-dependent oxidoreductase [Dehalococcoidales bacterium]